MTRLRLAASGWTLDLLPDLGGAIARLAHDGADILRPMPAGAADPLETGCFPLVPYANRIAHGRFAFAGESHKLPRNFGDHPHSLHGIGWQRRWAVAGADDAAALLAHRHDGGPGWPWRYRAEQRLSLSHRGFRAELSLANEDDRPMPAGLGFHPYFPLDAGTRLQARAERAWLAGPDMLPAKAVPPEAFGNWAAGAAVARDGLVDNVHDGWDGTAAIMQAGRRVALSAEGARAFHLYVPPGAGFFCVEPVTHLPDAVNRPGFAIDVLPPGGALRLAMEIGVAAWSTLCLG